MQLAAGIVMFSVLFPVRMWTPPSQPLLVTAKGDAPVTLVLTDFTGKTIETKVPRVLESGKELDLKTIWTQLSSPGTYVLFAVPSDKTLGEFVGTPIVIELRADKRPGAGQLPMVTKMEPLKYAVMNVEQGPITMAFYYDVAPNTAESFLTLSEQGFFNGLTFHRIVPGFVVQGGDPKGDGTGGPGYNIDAEFNDRLHEEGVLSMARSGDPLESQGMKPRSEFANSAGSQFFICLGRTENLDGRYTAFGKVTAGIEVVRALGKLPVADRATGRPEKPPVIKQVEVKAVTAAENPYVAIWPNFNKEERATKEEKLGR